MVKPFTSLRNWYLLFRTVIIQKKSLDAPEEILNKENSRNRQYRLIAAMSRYKSWSTTVIFSFFPSFKFLFWFLILSCAQDHSNFPHIKIIIRLEVIKDRADFRKPSCYLVCAELYGKSVTCTLSYLNEVCTLNLGRARFSKSSDLQISSLVGLFKKIIINSFHVCQRLMPSRNSLR